MIVQSGSDNSVQTISTNNLTIEALSGSNALDLSLGSGVTTIRLADYASGKGAHVTVIGNNSGNTITGNDGNDTLTGGSGNDTFNLGSGNNSVTGDGGLDTAHFSTTLTAADFTFSNNEWVVTNGGSTDDLSGISLVTDGAGHTFLLVSGGSEYCNGHSGAFVRAIPDRRHHHRRYVEHLDRNHLGSEQQHTAGGHVTASGRQFQQW